MQLAGARVVLGGDAGADVGLELVESIGDDLVKIVKNYFYDVTSLAPLVPLSGRGCKACGRGDWVLTVLSVEVIVETEPCGQPLPE